MTTNKTIIHKATASLKWSAMMEIVTRTAQPLVLLILAYLLVPEDFGIVGTAMIVISFSKMFLDAGLGKALIQTNASVEKAANVVFWTNITLGAILYIVIFLFAPLMAIFFNSPASALVLRVLGIQVIILSLTTVQQFLFMRDLNFRQLFWAKLAMALTPGFFSIPLAFYGHGVWALVTGTLVGSLLNMIILWIKSPWRPSLAFDHVIARQLFRFGFWVVLEGLGVWLLMWGDQLLVGKFLSIEELGIYRIGWSISALLFGLLLNPFLPVLYPTFSRLQDDMEGLKVMFHKANRIIIAIACPVGVGLLLTAPEIVQALFGNKWEGLGFVLAALGLVTGIGWLVGANAELYRAIGRPDVNTKLLAIAVFFYIPGFVISIQYGLQVFIIVRVILAAMSIFLHIYFCTRLLKFPVVYLWLDGKHAFKACMFMVFAIYSLKIATYYLNIPIPDYLRAILLVLMGIITYIMGLWFFDKAFCLDFIQRIRNAIQSTANRVTPENRVLGEIS
jgi:O-antigen/teichoic acid export membrane protein